MHNKLTLYVQLLTSGALAVRLDSKLAEVSVYVANLNSIMMYSTSSLIPAATAGERLQDVVQGGLEFCGKHFLSVFVHVVQGIGY